MKPNSDELRRKAEEARVAYENDMERFFVRLVVGSVVAVIVIVAIIMLTACSTTAPEPRIVTTTVTLPGELRSCIPPELRAPPAYPDTDEALRAAAGPDVRYQLVVIGRALRAARLGETEPLLAGCR